ncbi:MAG: aminotransferase class V-fold PLP-dependent enzyme [Candidatus Moranbacteria bacterium]|nr:aminotransferase class V-fold PLP-dependent enzyme [Candidatus Moranbacteria bacterium]
MLTFNVGPSKLSQKTKSQIKKAIDLGIYEISHRSEEFSKISKQAITGLRKFFKIPKDYRVFYTGSATDAMEIAVGNCCEQRAYHFTCGVFSEVFAEISQRYNKKVFRDQVDFGQLNDYKQAKIDNKHDFVAITQNETSTGVMCEIEDIEKARNKNREAILTIDITSSGGTAPAPIELADIWLFSVQKCFGLPAGLGIMIVSPKALAKANQLSKQKKNLAGYFTFENMLEKMTGKYQTVNTPNVINIYLLAERMKVFNQNQGLIGNIKQAQEKYQLLKDFIDQNQAIDYFVQKPRARSYITICLQAAREKIKAFHLACKKNNMILGQGYGELKDKTFRIANFPNISKTEMQNLIEVLKQAS